jgi:geranylgeranyl diphosphate synthase type II
MNSHELINDIQLKIENRIKEVAEIKPPETIYEPFNYVMSGGGKRIRPLLVVLSCGAIKEEIDNSIDAAVAVEILHNYTLVHDDIMDNSLMRRNRQTVHTKWDNATAILTGDLMFGVAFRILPDFSIAKRSDKISEILAQVNIDVCEGQALDMEFNIRKYIRLEDYLKMINYKTARLLSAAVLIGGNLAEASEAELTNLNEFATNLGIGFQIQDDVLDLLADEAKLGKTLGLDIVEGKKTILIIRALEIAKESEHIELLNNFMENNGADKSQISLFKEMFNDLGIFNYALTMADSYFEKAKLSLLQLKESVYREALLEILKQLSKREK